MELFYSEQNVKTIHGNTVTQALVEGEIPFPEETTLKKLLDSIGDVSADKVEVGDGKVSIGGRISLDIICEDEDGKIMSFSSWAELSHEIRLDEAKEGMTAMLYMDIQTLDTKLKDGVIALSAIVDIACRVIDGGALKAINSIGSLSDVEFKQENFNAWDSFKVGGASFRVRDEISAPNVSCVLYSCGNVVVRDVKHEGSDAVIEGNLAIEALCMDKEGRYSSLYQIIPFSEEVELEGNYREITCKSRLETLQVRVLGEEFGILAVEAQIAAELFACEQQTLTIPIDAYSPSCSFECGCEQKKLLLACPGAESSTTFSENVNVPDGMPEIYRIVWCSARPVVTAATVDDSMLTVEGLMFLRTIYQCDQGQLHSFLEDIPFRFSTGVSAPDGADANVRVKCVSILPSGAGKSFDVTFNLAFSAEIYTITNVDALSSVNECESRETPHGIIIYSTGGNETLFDIGKSFNISIEKLTAADPSICEKLKEGQKIVLFI